MKKNCFVGLAIGFLLLGTVGVSQAQVLDFNDSSDLGVTLGGNMQWNGTGGGHLYCESYNDDDLIIFLNTDTYVNSFQLNAMPWQGYVMSTPPPDWILDIEAFDASNTSLWSTQVDLATYQTWDSWSTVNVDTAGVSYLLFYATGGFWPSIDNLIINNGAVPASIPTLSEWGMIIMSLLLAGSAFWMLRKRQNT